MLVMLVEVFALFVSVTVCEALVVLVCWLPKANSEVDKRKPGAGTVTCAVTMCVVLPLLATMVTGYVPAAALVVPVMVSVEVPATPLDSGIVEGLNDALIPLTLWM